jgi:hypothetical protein
MQAFLMSQSIVLKLKRKRNTYISYPTHLKFSALSVEVEDMIKIEYGLLESENILWKALMRDRHHHICTYGSSNDERSSSTNVPENISLSSMHIDQD